jgi:hypothetical protein
MFQASMISTLRLNGPTVDDPPTIFFTFIYWRQYDNDNTAQGL